MTTWNRSFIDTFNRANSSSVGNGWLAANSSTQFSISGSRLNIASSASHVSGNYLCRPYTSNPASLVPGTNEGSVNQRAVVVIPNQQAAYGAMIALRADSSGDRCYGLFLYGGSNLYMDAVVGGTATRILGDSFTLPAQGGDGGSNASGIDAIQIDFSCVSADSTHTTISIVLTDLNTNTVFYTNTVTDAISGLQSPAIAAGATIAFSAFSGGSNPALVNKIQCYTDQAITVGSALTAGSISLGAVAANSIALTGTAASGGTASYTYDWFRSSTAPSGGNYGKQLLGQHGTGITDTGLQCGKTYYYTRRAADSTSVNPQVVYTTAVSGATSSGATNNPGNRSSLVMWGDADALIGQTNGSAISGAFGQFSVDFGLTSGFTAPTYAAATLPNGKAALDFTGSNQLTIGIGADAELDLAGSGSFTYTIVYNLNPQNSADQVMMSKGQRICAAMFAAGGGVNYMGNYDLAYGASHKTNNGYAFNKTTSTRNHATLPVAILQLSYDSAAHAVTIGNSNGEFTIYPAGTVLDTFSYAEPWSLGAFLSYNDPSGGTAFGGQIGQVLIDNAALSRAQMIADQAYFRARYATDAENVRVLALGDSRTDGIDLSGRPGTSGNYTANTWPAQLQTMLTSTSKVINYGIAGDTTNAIVPGSGIEFLEVRWGTNILLDDPAKQQVVIFGPIGVNDFNTSANTATQAATNVINSIQAIEALSSTTQYSFKTIWCTEMGFGTGGAPWDTYRTAMRTQMLAAVPAVAGQRGFVDLTNDPHMGPNSATSDGTYWGTDSLHPVGETAAGAVSPSGYNTMAADIFPSVGALITPPAAIVPGIITAGTSSLSVSPSGGNGSFTYQWYASATAGTKGSAISGATSSTYTPTGLTYGVSRYYTATIGDTAGGDPIDTGQVAVSGVTGGSIGIGAEGAFPAFVRGGDVTNILLTKAGASWTPGIPGLPKFSTDRGEILSQVVLTASNASVTLKVPNDSRPLTIIGGGLAADVQVVDGASPPAVVNGQVVPLGSRESRVIAVDFGNLGIISATAGATDASALLTTYCVVVGTRAVVQVKGGTSGNTVTVTANLSDGGTATRNFVLNRAA